MKTKIIHHINKHLTYEVIETQTILFGFIINKKFTTIIF